MRHSAYLCYCCSGKSYHCYHAEHRVILDVIFGDFCDLIEDKDLTTTWMLLEEKHNMKLRTDLKLMREEDFQHSMMNYISDDDDVHIFCQWTIAGSNPNAFGVFSIMVCSLPTGQCWSPLPSGTVPCRWSYPAGSPAWTLCWWSCSPGPCWPTTPSGTSGFLRERPSCFRYQPAKSLFHPTLR